MQKVFNLKGFKKPLVEPSMLIELVCSVSFVFIWALRWLTLIHRSNGTVFHDSLIPQASIYLFWRHLLSLELPLWDPFSNLGEPLLPFVELYAPLDPVVALVYSLGKCFAVPFTTLFAYTCGIWFLIFAWYSVKLLAPLVEHSGARIFFVYLIFFSNLSHWIPAQIHGCFYVFRYFPAFIFFLNQYLATKSDRSVIALCAAMILSFSGYQSAYVGLGMVAVLVAVFALNRHFPRPKHLVWGGVILVLYVLPCWVAFEEVKKLVVLPRVLGGQEGGWTISVIKWFRTLVGVDQASLQQLGHGFLVLGKVGFSLAALGLTSLAAGFYHGARSHVVSRMWQVLVVVGTVYGVMAFGVFGLREFFLGGGTFLGLRNWGFVVLLPSWLLMVACVVGLDRLLLMARRFSNFKLAVLLQCVLLLGVGFSTHRLFYTNHLRWDLFTQYMAYRPVTTVAELPRLVSKPFSTQGSREFIFDGRSKGLFWDNGPAVWSEPAVWYPLHDGDFRTMLSHNFRLPNFHLAVADVEHDEKKLRMRLIEHLNRKWFRFISNPPSCFHRPVVKRPDNHEILIDVGNQCEGIVEIHENLVGWKVSGETIGGLEKKEMGIARIRVMAKSQPLKLYYSNNAYLFASLGRFAALAGLFCAWVIVAFRFRNEKKRASTFS